MPEQTASAGRERRVSLISLLIALVLGTMIWGYVDSRRTEERVFRVPVEVSIPRGWEVKGDSLPEYVRVAVTGARQAVNATRPAELSIKLAVESLADAGDAQSKRYTLTADYVHGLPTDVRIVEVLDPEIVLNLIRPERTWVAVKVPINGDPAPGYQVSSIEIKPEHIAVFLPKSETDPIPVAETRPVDLRGRTSLFREFLKIEPLHLKVGTRNVDADVLVTVRIEQKPASRTFEKVPVSLLLATPMERLAGGKLLPPHVAVTVTGGEDKLKALASESLTVYIDTRDMGSSVQGEYIMKCRAFAPGGVEVLRIEPESVRWVVPTTAPEVTPLLPTIPDEIPASDPPALERVAPDVLPERMPPPPQPKETGARSVIPESSLPSMETNP